jgi:gliding motility-associated-like protein
MKMNLSMYRGIIVIISMMFFWGISQQKASAQINPPDFLCVENDTLKWTLPVNTCGPFVSYTVYFSADINGPYTILETVTNALTTQYYHMNANSANNIWYYYIESNFNCPGEITIQSDTLDNRDPDFPPIDAVTVTNGEVEIFWTPSLAPETAGYIIYQKTDIGSFEPIDTVYPETANYYLDLNADPIASSEEYTIVAIDGCGNTSIFNTASQASIFLETEINPCTQSATLNWNLYKNWTEGIEEQEIWVSINGGIAELAGIATATDTMYIYENLDDGNEYCFTLRTNRNNSSFFAESNETCLVASIIQPNRNLVLQSVSFTPDDKIELIWQWDTNSEINNVDINTSSENGNYSNLNSFPPDFPLTPKDTTYINNHLANDGKQYFQIVTTDDCDSTSISNYGATIFLTGESNTDYTNFLSWTPFDIENATILDYRIYKKTAVGETVIGTADLGILTYTDLIEINDIYDANACYYVVGYARVELPNGTVIYILSRSNTICLQQFTNIHFPNAFAPNGKNNIFKPLVAFPSLIASYELNVYNRWGEQVFTSSQYDQGWDGRVNGKTAATGVYVYQMKLMQVDGKMEENKGTVMLVR